MAVGGQFIGSAKPSVSGALPMRFLRTTPLGRWRSSDMEGLEENMRGTVPNSGAPGERTGR